MRSFKPYHVLIFIVGVFLLLAPFVYFVPSEGWDLNGFRFRFLSFEKFSNPVQKPNKDITDIVAMVDTSMIEEIQESEVVDSLATKEVMGKPSGGKMNTASTTQIAFSSEGINNLHQLFVKMEQAAQSNKKVRILHYGDSQIEGDRMTGYIRQRVQEQFGGNGPGMIPAVNVYNTLSFIQTCSPNFMRYTCFGGEKLKSRKYGIMNSAGRFTPEYMDSTERVNQVTVKDAWIEIEPSSKAYGRTRNYNNVYMHYSGCVKSCQLKIYQNGSLIKSDSLIADGKYHVYNLNFPSTPGKLRFEFAGAISPSILGFSLEGDIGVQVDNIAMRGSSGTFFGQIDQQLAGRMYNEMNAELIIMQFGGNSMPYMKDSASVRGYARQFKGQLLTIKKLKPSAAIIVIGPSDMSTLEDGVYVTYKLLPYLTEMMKKEALEIGAGYYDLYSAMGGKNSMPSWVEKGLAANDYIHFSNRGASIASQLFYDAFSAEYAKWKTK